LVCILNHLWVLIDKHGASGEGTKHVYDIFEQFDTTTYTNIRKGTKLTC